jgi:hypothetical protein
LVPLFRILVSSPPLEASEGTHNFQNQMSAVVGGAVAAAPMEGAVSAPIQTVRPHSVGRSSGTMCRVPVNPFSPQHHRHVCISASDRRGGSRRGKSGSTRLQGVCGFTDHLSCTWLIQVQTEPPTHVPVATITPNPPLSPSRRLGILAANVVAPCCRLCRECRHCG